MTKCRKYFCTLWNGTLETNTNINVTKLVWQYELYGQNGNFLSYSCKTRRSSIDFITVALLKFWTYNNHNKWSKGTLPSKICLIALYGANLIYKRNVAIYKTQHTIGNYVLNLERMLPANQFSNAFGITYFGVWYLQL